MITPGRLSPRDAASRTVFLGVLLLVMMLLATGPTQAESTHLTCGATISTDTTLTHNLTGCPNDGLVIGADNITLDLNGHTISGDGTPFASCPDNALCDIGVDNNARHTNVTIKHGHLRGFDVGIYASGGSSIRITGISASQNASFGMIVGQSPGTRIDHNWLADDGTSGIILIDSNRSRIDHNVVSDERGYAIPVFDSNRNRIDHNTSLRNDHGILLDTCNHSKVWANRITHSGGSSLDIGHSNRNRITGNVLTNNGDGIILFESNRNRVRNNTVLGTGLFGFPDTGGFGVLFDGARANTVDHNRVIGGRGPAMLVSSLDSQLPSRANLLLDNVATSKSDDGIRVDGTARGTDVRGNTTDRNGHDGIKIIAAGTSVADNIANSNRWLGIEAISGAIDGGGNRAAGNGNSLQCINVRCT